MFGAGANERWRPLRKSKMKMQPNPMKLFIDRIYIYTAVFRFIIPTKFIFLNSEKVKNKNKNKKKTNYYSKFVSVCYVKTVVTISAITISNSKSIRMKFKMGIQLKWIKLFF